MVKKYKKIRCAECLKWFDPDFISRKYCSEICRAISTKRRLRKWYKDNPEKTKKIYSKYMNSSLGQEARQRAMLNYKQRLKENKRVDI
jgi:uncharacterized protein VirK/YbjX